MTFLFNVPFSDRDESRLPPLLLTFFSELWLWSQKSASEHEKNFDFNLRIYSQNFAVFKLTVVCYSVDPSVGAPYSGCITTSSCCIATVRCCTVGKWWVSAKTPLFSDTLLKYLHKTISAAQMPQNEQNWLVDPVNLWTDSVLIWEQNQFYSNSKKF